LAVSVRVPEVANVIEQLPADTRAEQVSPVLAFTVTDPLGDAPPTTPPTLTLIVTGLPVVAGFGEMEVIVVVEGACVTTSETLFDAVV